MKSAAKNNIPGKVTKAAKKIFGKTNIKNIEPLGSRYINKHKIVVFVPLKNTDELAFGMASAGAGIIGNYTVCSFRINGVGTFLAGKGSKPKAGKKDRFEMVEEVRLEMICDKKNLDDIIDTIYEVHPYEEPAYEVYDVKIRGNESTTGAALIKLKEKVSVNDIFMKINGIIDTANLPGKIKNAKFKQAIIDYSENEPAAILKTQNKTLYIKKYKNITNIELI